MSPSDPPALLDTVRAEFVRYLRHLAGRVERFARAVPAAELYARPFPSGNSVGHLVLHLTGNLNHYVGAGIAGTGYERDRPREFTDPAPPPADVALDRFRAAIELVAGVIESLDAAGWQVPVAGEPPIETRFGLVLVCLAHLNNHLGQMAYLVQALGRDPNDPPAW